MIRSKKLIMILMILLIFGIWVYMVYDVNHRFPNPVNIACEPGETAGYKGVTLTAGEIEIFSYDEALEHYPSLADAYKSLGTDSTDSSENARNYSYVLVHVCLENTTDNTISFGKESIILWTMEAGTHQNGTDFFQFTILNPEYRGSVAAHETIDLILPYGMSLNYMSLEELKSSDIRIVYSYYPTKNYLYYQSAMEES